MLSRNIRRVGSLDSLSAQPSLHFTSVADLVLESGVGASFFIFMIFIYWPEPH